ncbi:hypothetical protein SDC9_165297 [bioreactor metagenome]|uniref:Uncharacterized protein n=1 Tax=bioreactor metagenome TaxID=1076179 RepID=A0A645FWI0_9ZZZZ
MLREPEFLQLLQKAEQALFQQDNLGHLALEELHQVLFVTECKGHFAARTLKLA